METSEVVVIGAGIVGLATAYQLLLSKPGLRVVVLEKEAGVAQHQTGRNSGVLHSGIYYKPGSHKSQMCRDGLALMLQFCETEGVPFEVCGKVIVATEEQELPTLQTLLERGRAAGVVCREISAEKLRDLEPHCAGRRALHVADTGIVDYVAACERLAQRIEATGGVMCFSSEVRDVRVVPGGQVITTSTCDRECRVLVNCAGLYSDEIAYRSGLQPQVRIVPFRGEYFELKPSAQKLCRNLIYPVPDPRYPFLGVHFTRMIQGGVECGPNAVLALAREGYDWRTIRARELASTLRYSGMWRLGRQHWKTGLFEAWRSLSRPAFVRSLQKLIPEIKGDDLVPAAAGVRAQAVAPDGRLVDDFAFAETERAVHVLNAPSPAATASLSIGKEIARRVLERF